MVGIHVYLIFDASTQVCAKFKEYCPITCRLIGASLLRPQKSFTKAIQDMKYKNFQEYLLINNLTDKLNDEERDALQKEWRKAYQKSYHAHYGKQRIRKTITISPQEEVQLQKAARKHGMKMNECMKHCIFAYLNNEYIVPEKKTVESLILQVRKIGTNINQVARFVNGKRYVEQQQLDVLYQMLSEIEGNIVDQLYHPDQLDIALKKRLEEDDSYHEKVAALLQKYSPKKKKV